MVAGIEAVGGALQSVEASVQSNELVDMGELQQQFEETVFGENQQHAGQQNAADANADKTSRTDEITDQIFSTVEGLNTELESTMEEVMKLIQKKPSQAELLTLQLKSVQLFIAHELSSKVVTKASDSLEQLVRGQ